MKDLMLRLSMTLLGHICTHGVTCLKSQLGRVHMMSYA